MAQVSYGTITITDIPSSGSTNQHFWFNPTQQGTLLAGAYVTDTDIDTFKVNKSGGYVLIRSNGVEFGKGNYKSIELIAGTQNDSLNFYEPNSNTIDASLTSGGLVLSKGGIKAGTAGQNGFVYLSSEDYQLKDATHNGFTINGHTPTAAGIDGKLIDDPAWREIIGTKFGVDSEGNLYASNAEIEGAITATSLTIGDGVSLYDGIAAINISGYTIEITNDSTGVANPITSTYLYPHLYHNGIKVTDIDYDLFIWYQDDDATGTEGDAQNYGRYLASYGHTYRVIYDFNDGEVGGSTDIQVRTIDSSKYITRIDDTGITIHPEVWTNRSSYIQLDGSGMKLFNSSGNSIAEYGSAARIGLEDSSRFLMNTGSLEAYDSNNNKYFEVNSSGLSWGNNTAATTSQISTLESSLANKADSSAVATAAMTATSYITYVNATDGIKIHNANDDVNYAKINSDGLEIFKNNISVASFGTSARIGAKGNGSSRVEIASGGIDFIMRGGSTDYSLGHIGYDTAIVESGTAQEAFFTFGQRSGTIGGNSLAVGVFAEASHYCSISCGYYTKAQGKGAHAEGWNTLAKYQSTHAEGQGTQVLASWGHAEGYYTTVADTGIIAHAEGEQTTASGQGAHAEGYKTTASGDYSHASGNETTASGNYSSTFGYGTQAKYRSQFAIGEYNDCSGSNYAFMIGHGGPSSPSNILTVNWSGNLWINGTLTQGSDKKLKKHIKYLDSDAENFINNLKPVLYEKDKERHLGFYAQDVEQADQWQSDLVGESGGYKTLNYIDLISPLVTYVQRLEKRIGELEKKDA